MPQRPVRHRAQGRNPGHGVRNGLADPSAALWIRQTRSALRRRHPGGDEKAWDDEQPRERHRVPHVVPAARQKEERRDQRSRCEHRILERPQPEHPADRVSACKTGPAQRPVVDREAARRMRRRVHAEAGDDGASGQRDRKLRPVVDTRDRPDGEHVPGIRDDLGAEARGQPHRVHPVQRAEHALVAGEVGDRERPGDGDRDRGPEEDQVRTPELERPAVGPVIASRDRSPPGPAPRR